MNRILVWDLPTRILHWLFAGSLVGALVLGFGVDDEHPLFAYHILLGLTAGFSFVLRLVLGVFGSRHARFGAWAWSPRALLGYLRSVFSAGARRYVSHNPAGTWVTAAMFLLVALLVATGILSATKDAGEFHEVLAVALVVTIALHLLGLAWHTLRYRENISRSMVDGRKAGPPDAAISSSYRIAGVFLVIAATGWTAALVKGYDRTAGRIRLPLTSFEIGFGESHDEGGHRGDRVRRHHHD